MKKILFVFMVSLFYFLSSVIPKANAAATNADFVGGVLEGVGLQIYFVSNGQLAASYSPPIQMSDNDFSTRDNWTNYVARYTLPQAKSIATYRHKSAIAQKYRFKSSTGAILLDNYTPTNIVGDLVTFPSVYYDVKTIEIYNFVTNSDLAEVEFFVDPDVTPPPVPTGLSAGVTSGNVNLAWNPVTGSADLAGYNIYLNGSKVNSSLITGTTFSRAVSNNVNNNWQLTSVDTTGNESVKSLTVTTHYDTISPISPIGLVSTPQAGGKTKLSWTANTEPDLAGYSTYQDSAKLNGSLIPTNEYLVSSLQPNTSYSFQVTASDTSNNESPKSSAVTYFLDTLPPAAPAGLAVTSGNGLVDLSWTANTEPDIARYRIDVNGVKTYTANHPNTSFQVPGLTNGTAYTFSITAEDATGNESAESAAVTATPKLPVPPAQPAGVTANVSDQKVVLNWSPVAPPVIKYIIYRDGVQLSEGTATTYTDTAVTNGTLYNYEVSAVNAEGESTKNQVFAKPADVTDLGGLTLPFNVLDMFRTALNFLNVYSSYIIIVLAIVFGPVLLAIVSQLLGFNIDEKKGKKKGKGKETGMVKEAKLKPEKVADTRTKTERSREKYANDIKKQSIIQREQRTRREPNPPKLLKSVREGRERKKDGTWTAREQRRHQEKMQEHIKRMRGRTI